MIVPALGAGHGRQRDVERPRARPHADDRRSRSAAPRRPPGSRCRASPSPACRAIVVDHGSPVHSSCVRSEAASTSAISGLSGVTGGGYQLGRGDLRAPVVGRRRTAGRSGPTSAPAQQRVGLRVDEQVALAQGAREGARVARARPRSRRVRCGSARNRSAIVADALPGTAPTIQVSGSARTDEAVASPGSCIGNSAAPAAGALISRAARAAAKARVTGRQHASAAIGAAPPHEPTLAGWTSSPSSPVG